jgi:hypothetical protein
VLDGEDEKFGSCGVGFDLVESR